MFEEFRDDAINDTNFIDEVNESEDYNFEEPTKPKGHLLGMSPIQRLIIAIMLFVITCVLSAFCLLITQKVIPPFL
jgi:hypothetical protein